MKDKKSVLLRTCKECKARYEVDTYQSLTLCSHCRPVKTCIHNIKVTAECQSCMQLYGSKFQRAM